MKSNQVLLTDDEELEFGKIPSSGSIDSFIDELLKDSQACTHTHTCNPPSPGFTHTHTCVHVHAKIVPPLSEKESGNDDDCAESAEKKANEKHGIGKAGNKKAVQKYREKKKAHTAALQKEVVELRAMNQQLLKRLQGQSALEAENLRLKCLLVDIRGRIEGEIGSLLYERPVKCGDTYQNIANTSLPGSYVINTCNMQCDDPFYCPQAGVGGKSGQAAVLNGQGIGLLQL